MDKTMSLLRFFQVFNHFQLKYFSHSKKDVSHVALLSLAINLLRPDLETENKSIISLLQH